MALIKCPDCGKDVSSIAAACPFCGRPMGTASTGVLRVAFFTHLKLIGNCSITVNFEGQSIKLTRGYYKDFVVPADGRLHKAYITCNHGILDSNSFVVDVNSGESKKVTITFNDGNLFNKWEYREDFLVTR